MSGPRSESMLCWCHLEYRFQYIRLINDIRSINSDGVFQKHCTEMYPSSLVLNKENTVDVSADVLDLSIEIEIDKFKVSVYDKRDKYKVNVIRL